MIFTNLAPNVSFRDLRVLSSFFLLPWKWKTWYVGHDTARVQAWFSKYLNSDNVCLVDSGRSALLLALRGLGLKEEDEVIVPGYTCIVVTNAIRAVGAIPKLVDITDDLNIDIGKVEKEIRPQTKAIIAQHTFGLPCDMVKLRELSDTFHLTLIEDCAHALGAHIDERPVGSFGDISFFSFGSDKIVSSVRGGALVVHKQSLLPQIAGQISALPQMPRRLLWQHICYISAFTKVKPFYRFGGKILLYAFRKLHITAVITEPEEKNGSVPTWSPTAYPNILAAIVYPQLRKLYHVKMTRRVIATYYQKHLNPHILLPDYKLDSERTYLHFPIFIERVEEYREYMKRQNIHVGADWNGTPIAPNSATQIDTEGQHISTATELSKKIVQLPIHQRITMRKARKIVEHTNTFLKS